MILPGEANNKPKIEFETHIFEKDIDFGEHTNVANLASYVLRMPPMTYEDAKQKLLDNIPKVAGWRYTLEDSPSEKRFLIYDSQNINNQYTPVLEIYEALIKEREKTDDVFTKDKTTLLDPALLAIAENDKEDEEEFDFEL